MRALSTRRNRVLAIMLAGVVALVFVTVVTVTVLIHDAEASHGLWNL